MATKTLLYDTQEHDEFKSHTELAKSFSLSAATLLKVANTQQSVELMFRPEHVKMTVIIIIIITILMASMMIEDLKMMRKTYLVQMSEVSAGTRGDLMSLEVKSCGQTMQESSVWTKLEPEVDSTEAGEASTYSLQSEAGRFECSVSALRWVCKEKVSLKYQFKSWEDHMERMESRQYMPAGPLMNITVNAGRLDEVYLPHWICIGDDPTVTDNFAVLHIDECGDVVDKVSEVTPSHVKLSEPVFSPRGPLVKIGLLKINCNVLIYQTNTAFLTLHVYLIPRDPGLQQEMDKRELSHEYKIIRKPHPETSLKMGERFILATDFVSAEITPKNLKLRAGRVSPNFFEMFIENPNGNFKLYLNHMEKPEPLWTCVIRKDEYQSPHHTQGKHFVDEHQCDLIQKVNNIGPILDSLLKQGIIQQEVCDQIWATPTNQEKIRKLYSGPLRSGGHISKDIFYKILKENEPHLVAVLKRKK